MSTDTAKLARYIGEMAHQMANMADDPSLHVLRFLLYLVVEEAVIGTAAKQQRIRWDKLHPVCASCGAASPSALRMVAERASRGTDLRGCLAGPALERVIESAGLLIAQQPCHFGNLQVMFLQIASCQIKSQAVENLAKRLSFRCEPTRQRSLAYAEPPRNLRHFRPAMRQHGGNGVLDVQSPAARTDGAIGESLLAVLDQK